MGSMLGGAMGGGQQTGTSNTVQDTLVQNYTPEVASIASMYQMQAAAAARAASQSQTQLGIDAVRQGYSQAFTGLKPYTQTGIQALDELNSYMGLGAYNPGSAPTAPTAPTLESIAKNFSKQDIKNYIMDNSAGFGPDGRLKYFGAGADILGQNNPDDVINSNTTYANPYQITATYEDALANPASSVNREMDMQMARDQLPAAMKDYNSQMDIYKQNKEQYDYSKQLYDQYTAAGPMTPEQVQAKLASQPGYQFQLNQGLDSIQRAGSARGMVGSGRLLQSLVDYGSGLAQQTYGDTLSRLAALAGAGQSAAGQLAQGAMQSGSNIGGMQMNLGDSMANSYLAQGQALSSGYLASNPNYQKIPLNSSTTSTSSGGGSGGGLGGIGSLLGGLGSFASGGGLMGLFGG